MSNNNLPKCEEDPDMTLKKKLEVWGIEAQYEYVVDSEEDFSKGKFKCIVTIGEYTQTGFGNRKKNARNAAARAMLEMSESIKFVRSEEKENLGIRGTSSGSIDTFISSQKALLSQEETACKTLIKKPNKVEEDMVKYEVKEIETTKYGGAMVTFWNDKDGPNFKSGEGVKVKGNGGEMFAIVTKVFN